MNKQTNKMNEPASLEGIVWSDTERDSDVCVSQSNNGNQTNNITSVWHEPRYYLVPSLRRAAML